MMSKTFLVFFTSAVVVVNFLPCCAQPPVVMDLRIARSAVGDVRQDLRVALNKIAQDENYRDEVATIMLLDEIAAHNASMLDNLEDAEVLRNIVAHCGDARKLEAADAWINIRANFILPEIDYSITLVESAQKRAVDRRIDAASIELRKQVRKIRRLWQSKKTSDIPTK